jgi:Lon protease-like protein
MAEFKWPVTYDAVEDLPAIIPIFPLAGAIFFPRANLPLNVFEPRYLQMVDDAMRGHRIIGMIQPSGSGEMRPPVYGVGCAGRLTSYGETDDGRMVISLRGLARFRVADELTAMTPYRQVRADYSAYAGDLDEIDVGESEARFDREGYLGTLRQYLRAIQVQIDWDWVEKAPVEVLINAFAMLAPLSPQEKQALLEARTLGERTEGALTLMQLAIAESGGGGFASPGGSGGRAN